MRVRRINAGFDQAQNGRVGRFIEVGDFFIHPVHGQRILDEIVCADAEKIASPRERIRHHRGRGNLNHHADFQVFVERHVLRAEFALELSQQAVGLVQFVQTGNHRIHHLDVALGARA